MMELININFINPAQGGSDRITTYSIGQNSINYYGAYLYPNVCRITYLGGGLVRTFDKHLNADEFNPMRYGTGKY